MNHFSLLQILEPEQWAYWNSEALQWKHKFETILEQEQLNLRSIHDNAYLCVGDQYLKTGTVFSCSLLTLKDMSDLLTDPNFKSEHVLLSEPFSLTERSSTQEERIQALLDKDINDEHEIFLPINHDGHWCYLSKKGGAWSVQDSQPIFEELSFRQKDILEQSTVFLFKLTGQNIKLTLETCGEQFNNYDCGTRVVNAYRKRVNEYYQTQTHKNILIEALRKQLSYNQLPESLFGDLVKHDEIYPEEVTITYELTASELQIIDTTSSSQTEPEKARLYKETLTNLINTVNKNGLFAQVENRISVNSIDIAKADKGESDEDFAIRLQEAEFRKAGLK
ncbi:hypothetical protein TUM19329_19330 [Legionella antarctica]|uniref:Uncharacterized protein n=1 Tax=Legionella antarctica TaxID=2708020 RepID=A0A6F8T6B3_9GAMM|nr:hypothetical protein [Legionella antarctica]BCA95572.1 hypothetical protein TUM19329_19330 [Legionella antarctica]